jgi:hypothetical protein
MTEEERIELLKWVAEVAPKEMGAEKWHESVADGTCNSVSFSGRHYLSLESDISDASACFAMLDAIENGVPDAWTKLLKVDAFDPYCLHVEAGVSDEEYNSIRQFSDADRPLRLDIMGIGATRAEAIARAFVAVFEAQKQESPPE